MHTEDAPRYACTLDLEDARARLPQIHALTARLSARERTGDRLVLRFADDGDTEALVEEFVHDEQRCCPFFGFDIRRGGREISLELSAPPQAGHMLDAAMDAFEPERRDDERLTVFRETAGGNEVDGP